MAPRGGIIYSLLWLFRWSQAFPNARMATFGMLMLTVFPWLLLLASSTLFKFVYPPGTPNSIGPALLTWAVAMLAFFAMQICGAILLVVAIVRTWLRNFRQRRAVKFSGLISDATSDPNRRPPR